MFQQWKDKLGRGFFNLLINKFDQTLQLLLDNYIGEFFINKLQVKDLVKGTQNVKFNTNQLNRLMGTKALESAVIGSIKLEQMSLQIMNTTIVFRLELISQEEIQDLLQNSTSFDEVKQRFQQSKEELRREMFGQQNMEDSLAKQSSPLKSSGTRVENNTLKYLRIFDTLCGNSSVKITNLTITLQWEDSKQRKREINLLFRNADILLKKYPESDSMYVKVDCSCIEITTGDSTIARMEQALSCEIYLCENNTPKIKIDLGLLNIILNQFEFQCIKDLFEIHQKNQNLWKLCESVEIQRTFQQSQIIPSHIDYNYLKTTLNKITAEQESKELQESTILIQSVRITPIEEFYLEALPLIKQKDSIFITSKGISVAISLNALGLKDFKESGYNIYLEEHFAVKIPALLFRKDNIKTHFEIQELQIYQFIPLEQEFVSLNSRNDDFLDCQFEDNFYIIRQILQIGGQIKQNGKYQGQQFHFEYPTNMLLDSPAIIAIQTEQINIKISPINITLNSNQIKFIQTLIPKTTNAPIKKVEPIKINIKFTLQPTQIILNYLLNPTRNLENINQFNPKYCQLKIINFWIQTPTNFNNQIHFKFDHIQLDQSLDIHNIVGAIEFPETILELKDRKFTLPISQYVMRLKECMGTQISIQVYKINLQLDDVSRYNDLFQQLLNIQQQQQQQQQSQCKQQQEEEKYVKKVKNTLFLKIKLNEINLAYRQLISIRLDFLKFFQTIDYRILTVKNIKMIDQAFVLPKLRSELYVNEQRNVLIESNHVSERFLMLLVSQQDMRLEVNQVKIKVGDLSFRTIFTVLQDFQQFRQTVKNEDIVQGIETQQSEQFQYLIEIKNSSIEIHPYHNEQIKLKKVNTCKTQSDQTNYFCQNKTQLDIDQITIKRNQIKVDAIHVYFLYEQNNYQLNKIAIIQSLILTENFKNIYIFKTTIQQINAKLIHDIIDHSYYITENLPKPQVQQQIQQSVKQCKMEKILFENSNICIGIQAISVQGNIFQLDIMNSQLNLGNQSMSASIDRVVILDLLKQSQYKYVLDQNTEADYYVDETSTNDYFKYKNKNPFLQIVAHFNFNSLNAWIDMKPIRLCLSGVFLESLLTLLNTEQTVICIEQSDDEDIFEIVEQKKQFNLQLQIQPIVAIISFDSNGIKLDGILKGLISLGSLNNLILASQYIDFYAFDQDATGQFIKTFLTSFGSTFELTLKAYNSLEIFNAFNSLSQGVTNLFMKPFYNQKGIVYGTAEGCKDLVCGFASSILNLAQLPTKVLNRFAEAIGMSIVTKPLVMLNGVCQKLYEKINPGDEVPLRFLK